MRLRVIHALEEKRPRSSGQLFALSHLRPFGSLASAGRPNICTVKERLSASVKEVLVTPCCSMQLYAIELHEAGVPRLFATLLDMTGQLPHFALLELLFN